MKSSDIPTKFNIPFANAAGASYVRSIPQASQIGINDGFASLTDGFPPLNFQPIASGGVPPFGQDMNGILQQITQWSRWIAAGGPLQWDSSFAAAIGGYPQGACVQSATVVGKFWLSSADNNTSNPDAGGVNWVSFPLETSVIHYGADSGGQNAMVVAAPQPPITAYATGLIVATKPLYSNNGFATLNVEGPSGLLGAKTVIRPDGNPLYSGDVQSGAMSLFMYDGTYFQAIAATGRPQLVTNTTLYVDQAIGNDSNDGNADTAGHALKTIQRAIDIAFSYGAGPFQITIEVAIGSYPTVNTPSYPGPAVNVVSSNGSPSSTFIQGNGTAHCFQANGPNTVTINGIGAVNSAGSFSGAYVAGQGAILTTLNTQCGTVGQSNFEAFGGGQIVVAGAHNIVGAASSIFWALAGTVQVASNITITVGAGSLAITNFALVGTGGSLFFNTPPQATFVLDGAAPTGSRYNVSENGIIQTNGAGADYLPGTTAGTASSGGQYL